MCVISIIHSLLIYIWFKTTHPYLHALFFPIPCPAAFGEVVDRCKLNQGREDKGIAHCHEPVHGSGIGHLRKGVSSTDAQGGHGKHSGDPWGGKENIRTHILLRENNVDEKPDSLFQRQKWFFCKHIAAVQHCCFLKSSGRHVRTSLKSITHVEMCRRDGFKSC